MRPLGHAHRPARLVDGDLDAELGEHLDEDAHRRQRAMVDDGAGPVEDDGLQMAERRSCLSFSRKGRRSTSSAMAKEVLAPVPLVIMTRRTRVGRPVDQHQPVRRRCIGAGPALDTAGATARRRPA